MNLNPNDQLRELLSHIDGAYAPNTIRAYRADMEEFIRYCQTRGEAPIGASPEVIARFLIEATDGSIRSATIRRKVASISAVHRLMGLIDPTKHPEVKLAVRKLNRKLGTCFKQAYPINRSTLELMLNTCDQSLRGMRNKALLMVGYESMARRAELVSLKVSDIEKLEGGASRILLRRSKTDQTSEGKYIHLGETTTASLCQWIDRAKIIEGFVFRGVQSSVSLTESLGASHVSRIYKKLACNAGLPKSVQARISGHSPRVGAAQDLVCQGTAMPEIMVRGGWVKPDTMMRYVQRLCAPGSNPWHVSNSHRSVLSQIEGTI